MASVKSREILNDYRSVDSINSLYQLLVLAIERINYSFLANRQHETSSSKRKPITPLGKKEIWPIAGFLSQAFCICRSLRREATTSKPKPIVRVLIETYVENQKTGYYNWQDEIPQDLAAEAKPLSIKQIAELVLQSLIRPDHGEGDLTTDLGRQVVSMELKNARSFKISEADDYLPPAARNTKPIAFDMSEAEQKNLFSFLRFVYFLLTNDNVKIFVQLLAIYYNMAAADVALDKEDRETSDSAELSASFDSLEQTCRAICRIDNIDEVFVPSVSNQIEIVMYQSLSNLNAPRVSPDDPDFQEFYRIFSSCGNQPTIATDKTAPVSRARKF